MTHQHYHHEVMCAGVQSLLDYFLLVDNSRLSNWGQCGVSCCNSMYTSTVHKLLGMIIYTRYYICLNFGMTTSVMSCTNTSCFQHQMWPLIFEYWVMNKDNMLRRKSLFDSVHSTVLNLSNRDPTQGWWNIHFLYVMTGSRWLARNFSTQKIALLLLLAKECVQENTDTQTHTQTHTHRQTQT